jgi:preprotein translocase subunit YajC
LQVAIFPVLMVGAIYLLLWRPQQKRISAVRQLQAQIQEGDEVLTTSGIYGTITMLGESDAYLEIAPGTVIHVARGAIGQRIEPDTLPSAGDQHDGETGAD